jgi:hypothetical protein
MLANELFIDYIKSGIDNSISPDSFLIVISYTQMAGGFDP